MRQPPSPPRLPPDASTNPHRIAFCIPGIAFPLPCRQIVFPGPPSLGRAGKDLSPPRGAFGFPCLCRRGPPGSPASAAGVPVSPVSAAAGLSVSPVSACISGAVLPLPRGQRPVSAAGGFRFPLSPPQGASGFPSLRCNRLPVFPVSATGGFRLPSVSAAGGFRVPPYIRRGGFQLPPVSAAAGPPVFSDSAAVGGPGFPASAAGGHRVPLSLPQGATGFPCLRRRGFAAAGTAWRGFTDSML